ncbi:Mur ligase family protein [Nannocystis sp. SCPEA4]|uniref:bifunctional folylpolyglutamate synthase/dihydrofolate synthase n=1 Tax=Nannocystis sp. SCPEA4 TaxID=2996787 RepID=UPI00226E6270|nr:Mur ligase family protein [Nannocystis sp. SCPEA4]MCY1057775.1 Mur ligase family protein [Nannocystis sp. SCPEA4]
MSQRTPPAWQSALFARRTLGMIRGLEAVRAAHAALGRPAAGVPVVHVVGTNGKGSTSAMVAHALRRRGHRVGLYTSPHLHRVGERIRIDGAALSDAAMQALVDRVLAVEGPALPRALTFFEILTVAALLAFAEAGVEVMVLETGLGGRLDATGVVPATVTLMTPIDLDHQAYLGDTIEAIAGEKAAVMRDGAPVFSAPQQPAAAAVLRAAAAEHGVALRFVEPLARAPAGLPGEHQRVNGALALAGARVIDATVAASDLDGVRWPARCERVVSGGGTVVFDAGHNPHGIAALVTWLEGQPHPRRALVFGCLADKDAPGMVAQLRRLGAPLWLVPPAPDAYDLGALAGADSRLFADPDAPEFRAAWDAHLAAGGEIVVCGSHMLVGRLRGEVLGEAVDEVALTDPLARR